MNTMRALRQVIMFKDVPEPVLEIVARAADEISVLAGETRAARGKVSAERHAARADHRALSRGVSSQRLTQRRRARLRRTLPGLLAEVRNRVGGSQLPRSEYDYRRGDERFRKRLLLPR